MLDDVLKILPALESHIEPNAALNWSGLRPMTPAGPPLVGPTLYKNLFLNTGHGPLGWTMACGSASLITDFIRHGRVLGSRVGPKSYTH